MITPGADAIYADQSHPRWQGNPLIAALPEVMPLEQFAEYVTSRPFYDSNTRNLPAQDRIAFLCDCEQLFIPFETHLQLYQRLTRLIRVGYENRNPLKDLSRQKLDEKVKEFYVPLRYGLSPHQTSSVQGFALTGITGVGKSTALHSVFRFYPQVLVHREYEGKAVNQKQLVWLVLNVPEDGSLKSLCKAFFEMIDQIMGTDYAARYAKDSYSVSSMVPHVARVAALVNLGVLVIDEIQVLDGKRSQGPEVMLNFFTRLTNVIGVPVVLVGTPQAREVLDSALHQIRRNSGQGEMQWGRLSQNRDWDRFIEELWEYQYLQKFTPLTPELSEAMHRVSSGIVGFATKIFIVAQERAINTRREDLTSELIETVAKQDFTSALVKLQKLNASKAQTPSTLDSAGVEPPEKPAKRLSKPSIPDGVDAMSKAPSALGPARMIELARQARAAGTSVYEALRDQGLVKNASEFLE